MLGGSTQHINLVCAPVPLQQNNWWHWGRQLAKKLAHSLKFKPCYNKRAKTTTSPILSTTHTMAADTSCTINLADSGTPFCLKNQHQMAYPSPQLVIIPLTVSLKGIYHSTSHKQLLNVIVFLKSMPHFYQLVKPVIQTVRLSSPPQKLNYDGPKTLTYK